MILRRYHKKEEPKIEEPKKEVGVKKNGNTSKRKSGNRNKQ